MIIVLKCYLRIYFNWNKGIYYYCLINFIMVWVMNIMLMMKDSVNVIIYYVGFGIFVVLLFGGVFVLEM